MIKWIVKNKNRIYELFRYGGVGISVTLLNVFLYMILSHIGIKYKTSNLIAIVISKIYGYIANKRIVFKSHCESFGGLVLEIIRFIAARGLTGIIDYFGLIVMVEILSIDKNIGKYLIQIVVIVINYILGKFLVFKKSQGANNAEIQSGQL